MNAFSKTALSFLFAIMIICTDASYAANERTVTIATRPGITVGFVLVEPDTPPLANVILLVGGTGKLELWRRNKPLPLDRGNFLSRTRRMFARHGLVTALVDVPSDWHDDGLVGTRHTTEHRADIEAVVRWMKGRANLPVWLVGTSRGSVSVAHLAATLPIDGAVFSASVTRPSKRRNATALDGKLEAVTVPVLIVHHRDDDCAVTPSSDVHMILDRLKNAAAVEVMMFSGGRSEDDNGCRAMTYHGFLGIEDRVVAGIAGWIRAHLPARGPR